MCSSDLNQSIPFPHIQDAESAPIFPPEQPEAEASAPAPAPAPAGPAPAAPVQAAEEPAPAPVPEGPKPAVNDDDWDILERIFSKKR